MKHTKAARFFDPIFAVKNDSRGFQCMHVSFQSTLSCNIAYVNALNECTNFVEVREKGRGEHKQQWVIEMSHARRIYLATYFWIDVLDGGIQNAHILCRVWNYWHSPMNHFLDIKISSTYNIYLECCEGLLCNFWKFDNPVTYQKFREIISSQMLSYNPVQKRYPGYHRMRAVTRGVRTQHSVIVGEVTGK